MADALDTAARLAVLALAEHEAGREAEAQAIAHAAWVICPFEMSAPLHAAWWHRDWDPLSAALAALPADVRERAERAQPAPRRFLYECGNHHRWTDTRANDTCPQCRCPWTRAIHADDVAGRPPCVVCGWPVALGEQTCGRCPEPQPAPVPGGAEVLPVALALVARWGTTSPVTADRLALADRLCAMLRARVAVGVRTYGTPLAAHNGRDALRDCREEVADAVLYGVQAALEGRDTAECVALLRAVAAAIETAAESRGEGEA